MKQQKYKKKMNEFNDLAINKILIDFKKNTGSETT